MNLKQKIAENTSISFIGKIISSLLGIISISLIARELGPEAFGSYNIVIAFLYIFSVFADFGLYNILTREISRPNSKEKEIISNILFSRIFLLLFFYSLAFIITYFIPFYSQEIKIGIFVSALGFMFLSMSQILMSIFQKHLKTIYPAIADITTRIIQLIMVFYLYKTEGDFIDFLLIFVLGSFINFILVFYFSRKIIFFKLSYSVRGIKKALKQGWPLAVSAVLVLIYFKGDTIILSFLKGSLDVGIYNMAYKIIENIIFFPAMFVGLIMPLLSNYFISNKNQFKKVFQKSFDLLNMASIPIIFGSFFLAEKIILLIGGAQYTESILTFKILIISIFFIFLGALFGNAIIAINKQKSVMIAYAVAAIFNIVANIILIEKYSYIGASIVSVITELLATSLMMFIVFKHIKFIPHPKLIFKTIISSFFMIFSMWLMPFENLLILVIVGIVSYFLFMYLTKAILKEDLIILFKKDNAKV